MSTRVTWMLCGRIEWPIGGMNESKQPIRHANLPQNIHVTRMDTLSTKD